MQIADAVQNAWIMSGGIDECVTFSSDFFFAKLMQIGIRRKRRDAPSPAKICFTSCCPPSSHQNALSRALKLKLQTASWSLGRPSTHHTPSTCYQTRYVLPYIYKIANDEADRDIDDCFLVPCSLCKGLGRCKVFIHSKNEQIGGDLLLSTEKLAEKVRISGRRNFATNVRLSWK